MSIPGTNDPCLNCGPVGSDAYTQCHSALAAKVGAIPDCAKSAINTNQQNIANAGVPVLSGIEQGVLNLQSGLANIQSLVAVLTSPDTWIRVGLFMLALLTIIIGFWVVASQQQAPQQQAGGAAA